MFFIKTKLKPNTRLRSNSFSDIKVFFKNIGQYSVSNGDRKLTVLFFFIECLLKGLFERMDLKFWLTIFSNYEKYTINYHYNIIELIYLCFQLLITF